MSTEPSSFQPETVGTSRRACFSLRMITVPYRSAPEPRPPSPLVAGGGSVPLAFVLSIVTAGVYELFWYWRRRAAFDALDVPTKVSSPLLVATAGLLAASIVLAKSHEGTSQLCVLGGLVARCLTAFQARGAINEWAVREKMPGAPSGGGTIFFRFVYLQWRINRIVEREQEIAKLKLRRV